MSKPVKLRATTDFQDEVIAKLKRTAPDGVKYGTYEVSRSNKQVLSAIKYVLTTGIRVFDDLVGGMPFGRVCEIYGLESCGKTSLVFRSAIRAQQFHIYEVERDAAGVVVYKPLNHDEMDVAVLYIDNEQSVDDDSKLTVDGTDADVILSRCDTIEMMFKMVDNVMEVAKEREARFEEAGKPRKQFVVVIVDTIASTSSKEELAQEWGKDDYPRQAAQISKGFRKLMLDINRQNVCMICTNQVRDNIKEQGQNKRPMMTSTPQDNAHVTFGGKALKFAATHRIFMYQMPTKYRLVPTAQFAAGYLVGFFSKKNRIKKPLREGRMALLFDDKIGGLNDSFSILESLLFIGQGEFAEIQNKEKGTNIAFKFARHEIPTTTFDVKETTTTLAEDDEKPVAKRGRGRKDPSIFCRAEWPAFYEAHRADIDLLWAAAVKHAMQTEGLGVSVPHGDEDDEQPYAAEEKD